MTGSTWIFATMQMKTGAGLSPSRLRRRGIGRRLTGTAKQWLFRLQQELG
jgi:hypothetical protein